MYHPPLGYVFNHVIYQYGLLFQVAAALDALNAATEQPRQQPATTSGEHPPPGYDEAVGMVTRPAKATGGYSAGNAAPVLPPRRAAGNHGNNGNGGEPLSLAERYGLPVAEI